MQILSRIDKITGNTLFSMQWRSLFWSFKGNIDVQIALQKPNLFLWIPVIFAFGIGTYFYLPVEPPLFSGVFLLALSLAIYTLASRALRPIILAFLIYTAGFSVATFRTYSIDTPILSKKISTTVVTGRVREIEKLDEGQGSRMIIDVADIEKLSPEVMPLRVRLTIRKDSNVRVGQNVRVLAGLNPPSAPLIPGGFDFRRYLYFQKIGAVGFVYTEPEILPQANTPHFSIRASWSDFIESLRPTYRTSDL